MRHWGSWTIVAIAILTLSPPQMYPPRPVDDLPEPRHAAIEWTVRSRAVLHFDRNGDPYEELVVGERLGAFTLLQRLPGFPGSVEIPRFLSIVNDGVWFSHEDYPWDVRSLASEDIDDDGDMDLFVFGEAGSSRLYRNRSECAPCTPRFEGIRDSRATLQSQLVAR